MRGRRGRRKQEREGRREGGGREEVREGGTQLWLILEQKMETDSLVSIIRIYGEGSTHIYLCVLY